MDVTSNWSGNVQYSAKFYHAPSSVEELQSIVHHADKIRAIGTRHSFSECADSSPGGELVSLDKLPPVLEVDELARAFTCGAGMTCADVAKRLQERGWALHTLASLPHLSIAGAIATATHGSGDRSGNFLSALVGCTYVDPGGSLVTCGNAVGEAADTTLQAVCLGSIGVLVEVTLRMVPSFEVRQDVYSNVPWQRAEEQGYLDDLFGEAYSVSLFTTWTDQGGIDQLWIKRAVAAGDCDAGARGASGKLPDAPKSLFGGSLVTRQMHPLESESPEACTHQGEPAGPWLERLCHFRADRAPSAAGSELQSEYFVARERASEAIKAVRSISAMIRPLLHVSELRSVASDDMWLSPCYRQPSVGIHFTWRRDLAGVRAVLPVVEAALAPFSPRPHWGKLHTLSHAVLEQNYPKLAAYRSLLERIDPAAKFRNAYVEQLVFGNEEEAAPDAAPFPLYGSASRDDALGARPYDLLKGGHVAGPGVVPQHSPGKP
jgi:xylitol oxidase